MTAEQPHRTRRFPVVPVVIALAAVLAVVAFIATDGRQDDARVERTIVPSVDDDGSQAVEEVRDVSVSGDPLPELVRGTEDSAVGIAAPTISGRSFDGKDVTIGLSGSPQLVFVVAHWCPHCQKEVPVIAAWLEGGEVPAGVEFRAISTSVNPNAPNYPPSEWLEDEGWDVPTIADDGEHTAARALGLSGYPFFVAIRADGTIAARASGELTVEQIETLAGLAKDS